MNLKKLLGTIIAAGAIGIVFAALPAASQAGGCGDAGKAKNVTASGVSCNVAKGVASTAARKSSCGTSFCTFNKSLIQWTCSGSPKKIHCDGKKTGGGSATVRFSK